MRGPFMGNEQERLLDLFNEARAKRAAEERAAWLKVSALPYDQQQPSPGELHLKEKNHQ